MDLETIFSTTKRPLIRCLLLLIILFPFSASAVEFSPYPTADISIEQYDSYYKIIKDNFSDTVQKSLDQNLEIYFAENGLTNYVFTIEGHPAHPAWVARRVERSEDGAVSLSQIGYFAGKEEPFKILFQQYKELNDKIKSAMNTK